MRLIPFSARAEGLGQKDHQVGEPLISFWQKDSLDPAAVRPGRFDKKIHVPLPDIKGRTDIFEFFLSKIPTHESVTAKSLAQMTPGFSGAEVENLVNTAISEAVHNDKEMADLEDFEYSRD